MIDRRKRVCPVELADSLDSRIRGWIQNPRRILGSFIHEGMTVLDVGCGPGFFAIEIAKMVGPSGRVIAADLQEGMLEKVRAKIQGTPLESRVRLHRCQEAEIALSERVDFVLAFYMVHELTDQTAFFAEIRDVLNPDGQLLVVEPPLHVTRREFEAMLRIARDAGFTAAEGPRVLFSKSVLLRKG